MKYSLAQQIAITRRPRAMVGRAVALNAEHVAVRIAYIPNRQVNSILAGADLLVNVETTLVESFSHRILKIVGLPAGHRRWFRWELTTALRVCDEVPKRHRATVVGIDAVKFM